MEDNQKHHYPKMFGKIHKYDTISKYEISVQTYGSTLLCSIDEDDLSRQDAQLLVPQCPATELR